MLIVVSGCGDIFFRYSFGSERIPKRSANESYRRDREGEIKSAKERTAPAGLRKSSVVMRERELRFN